MCLVVMSKDAFSKQLKQILQQGLDSQLSALAVARAKSSKPAKGWLGAVRGALGLSMQQVASRMGIKRQPYREIETREARETVSLGVLRRAADAMDCELVYFLVPRTAPSFQKLSERFDPLHDNLKAVDQSMKLEGQDLYFRKPEDLKAEG